MACSLGMLLKGFVKMGFFHNARQHAVLSHALLFLCETKEQVGPENFYSFEKNTSQDEGKGIFALFLRIFPLLNVSYDNENYIIVTYTKRYVCVYICESMRIFYIMAGYKAQFM